jgi:hypothetical protein
MTKLIAIAAVVGAVLIPAAANAATTTRLSGVVVAKEAARHTFVVASPQGKLTTVRSTARQLTLLKVGSRIAAVGTQLADGSLHATSVKRSGIAKSAHLRVTVLEVHGSKVLVAGGGSAFAIRFKSAKAAHLKAAVRKGGLAAGDRIETNVKLSHGGVTGGTIHTDGQSGLIDFSGKVTALDSTSLTITDDGIPTVVAIPDGMSLPAAVQVGSEVEIVASVSGSTLTLVEVKLDGDGAENGDDGGSNVDGDGIVHVDGFVTSLDSGSITIQPGDNASPVTFAIPDGFSLPAGLAAGSKVDARGDVVNNVLTLSTLKLATGEGDGGGVETEGTVTALDSGSITIQPAEDGTPLTFAIPDGFTLPDGLQVGSLVDAKGDYVSSVLTLTELALQDGGGDGGGDG